MSATLLHVDTRHERRVRRPVAPAYRRDLDDAASFAREQEVRPGVDQRDEVLHRIERAKSKEEAFKAAGVAVAETTDDIVGLLR